jgi:hypothetical protein
MRNKRLSTSIKVALACVPSAGAATGMTAVEVAGAGFDRALYILQTGAQATGGTMALKIQEAAATGMGTPADITGGTISNLAASSGSKVYMIDVPVNPAKTFQQIVGTIGTDTIANSIVCILYCGTNYPVATTYATQLVTVA